MTTAATSDEPQAGDGDVHHSRSLVHGVLREGQQIRLGRLGVEAGEFTLTVSVGGAPLIVLSRFGDDWQFCARPLGPAHPEVVSVPPSDFRFPISTAPLEVRQRAEAAGKTAPLVRLGPGGPYVRDIYPEDLRR